MSTITTTPASFTVSQLVPTNVYLARKLIKAFTHFDLPLGSVQFIHEIVKIFPSNSRYALQVLTSKPTLNNLTHFLATFKYSSDDLLKIITSSKFLSAITQTTTDPKSVTELILKDRKLDVTHYVNSKRYFYNNFELYKLGLVDLERLDARHISQLLSQHEVKTGTIDSMKISATTAERLSSHIIREMLTDFKWGTTNSGTMSEHKGGVPNYIAYLNACKTLIKDLQTATTLDGVTLLFRTIPSTRNDNFSHNRDKYLRAIQLIFLNGHKFKPSASKELDSSISAWLTKAIFENYSSKAQCIEFQKFYYSISALLPFNPQQVALLTFKHIKEWSRDVEQFKADQTLFIQSLFEPIKTPVSDGSKCINLCAEFLGKCNQHDLLEIPVKQGFFVSKKSLDTLTAVSHHLGAKILSARQGYLASKARAT